MIFVVIAINISSLLIGLKHNAETDHLFQRRRDIQSYIQCTWPLLYVLIRWHCRCVWANHGLWLQPTMTQYKCMLYQNAITLQLSYWQEPKRTFEFMYLQIYASRFYKYANVSFGRQYNCFCIDTPTRIQRPITNKGKNMLFNEYHYLSKHIKYIFYLICIHCIYLSLFKHTCVLVCIINIFFILIRQSNSSVTTSYYSCACSVERYQMPLLLDITMKYMYILMSSLLSVIVVG